LSGPNVGEDPKFTKSTFSGAGGCLEVAHVDDGVLLRNSRFPDSEPMRLTMAEWRAFRLGVQHGEFCFD
jgi:Domain of unknown function (DUF397)